jgi:hypothetical protein
MITSAGSRKIRSLRQLLRPFTMNDAFVTELRQDHDWDALLFGRGSDADIVLDDAVLSSEDIVWCFDAIAREPPPKSACWRHWMSGTWHAA